VAHRNATGVLCRERASRHHERFIWRHGMRFLVLDYMPHSSAFIGIRKCL
jgi:hypothetical protein